MTKEDFLAIATKKYDELQGLNKIDCFYDYEKEFVDIWTELGRQVMEKNIGDVPQNHQKKTPFGLATEK